MARPMCAETECLEEGRDLHRIQTGPFEVEVWLCREHLTQIKEW